MKQDDLVYSLKRIRRKLCAYIGDCCDCKFMTNEDSDDDICRWSEKGSGCPEIHYASMLIEAMTPAELHKIGKRTGIILDPSEKHAHKPKINKIIDKLLNISKQVDKATKKVVETKSRSNRY